MNKHAFDSADAERFDQKISVMESGCHLWCGSLTPNGYANFTVNGGEQIHAHRFAFWLKHGRLPEPPMVLDHLCRNRHCVNPDHMEEVTMSVNYWRGDGPKARRQDPSKCRAGLHDWVEENLSMTSRGVTCKECKRIAQRAAYARRTSQQSAD